MELNRMYLKDINEFETRFRTTFINSLGGYKTPVLIGTCDKSGKANLAIFNSHIHIGANPPLIGFIIRPDSVERHTLQNILETGMFSVNHVIEFFYKKAHQTSARYTKEQNEFTEVGLTEQYIDEFPAPFVLESTVKIGLAFKQKIDITINGTILIIGEIQFVSLPKDCVTKDGFVNLQKAGSIASSGLDAYYNVALLSRLQYAKPNMEVEEIKPD